MEMRKYVKQDAHVDMDMTPMIDIVFLLIIFFMLVTELTNLEMAELKLPVAEMAELEKPQPGDRTITVNIVVKDDETGEGEIQVGGGPISKEELASYLKQEVVAYGKDEQNPVNPNSKDSLLQVMIRADWGVNSGHIHDVYKACQEAKIFKVRVAARKGETQE